MGESPDKEQLGGARAQTRAGAVDNEAADEDDALDQLRRFLVLPAGQRVGGAADRRVDRRPAARREEELLAIVPRESRQTYRMRRVLELVLDGGSVFELGARYGRSVDHGAGAPRRTPGRRAGLRPHALRRRAHGRRVGQARALRRRLRRLPPAGGQLRRPAGLRDRHRGRARGHDAPRRARAGRRAPGAHAVVLGARAQGLRRRRRGPRRRLAAEPALRLAQRRLGLAAHRRRHRGGLPARARGRRRSGRAARRDRGAPERRALAVPHGRALQRRGDRRPARHAPAAVRLGGARPRARRARRRPRARWRAARGREPRRARSRHSRARPAVRGRRPRRLRRQRGRPAAPRGRDRGAAGVEVGALPRAAAPRARRRPARAAVLHAAPRRCGWPATASTTSSSPTRPSTARRCARWPTARTAAPSP